MATIEVLALARSPDDLRSSLRAAKEKYGAQTGTGLGGVKYVGREGIVGPLKSTDAVVDVFAMDRGHFDAANAAKARTHWLHGEPGNLALIDGDCPNSVQVQFCCVPLCTFCSVMACIWPALRCDFWFCRNWRYPHEDMAFPDWADRALVFTDKGVVGRRDFTGKLNAITWDGFRIEDVRIRTFDACLCSIPTGICFCFDEPSEGWFERDPLETACYFGFGFLGACCRYAFCRPEAPGLYRATISSIHHKREGRDDGGPMATIEVLALARSPDDLRSSLRAAKEKYRASTAAAAAWANHFAAFGSQDVGKILLDYCEQSKIVVYNWHDDTETVYNGMAGAKRCFNELFAKLKDLSGLAAPVIHVEEGNPKSVFLIWRCPTSGFTHCTDTFLFDDAGKIVRQTVCILNEGAPACKAPLCTEPQGGPVQASWDNHFAAFGAQDVDRILLDYTEKSTIKVYNQVTDELTEFKGLKAVKECFTGLFSDLSDLSGLAAPAIRVEEATEGKAGMVFLVWRCPSSGYNHATDTFLFDKDGKIAKQNVVIMKPAAEAGE